MKRLVDVPRSELNIGDRILAKHLNDAMDDYLFTVEREQEQAAELPTEPYTVIRVQWHNRSRGDGSYVLHPEPYGGVWVSTAHDAADWVRADQIQEYITSFEVLAEPRDRRIADEIHKAYTEGARAVYNRMREQFVVDDPSCLPAVLLSIARQFELDS